MTDNVFVTTDSLYTYIQGSTLLTCNWFGQSAGHHNNIMHGKLVKYVEACTPCMHDSSDSCLDIAMRRYN